MIEKVLEKYTKLWDEIKYHIQTINAGEPGEYEKNNMKIKLKIKIKSDDGLPLIEMLKLDMLTIIVRSIFEEDGKYYTQVFLDKCLYEVLMREYDRIDFSDKIEINKTNASKECYICHYWHYLDKKFNYEPYLCNAYHDRMQIVMNFNDVVIVSVKESDYKIDF